jgi:rare lipoprotein A
MSTSTTRPWSGTLLRLAAMVLLAGCATREPAPVVDGAEARPPQDLTQVPDAVPQIEPIRPGGPNKPYEALGETYSPLAPDAALAERGLASWYGRKFHGRRTASGEVYDMYAMTAAHRTLPLPSYVRVSNPANGRTVIVRVNDRGPFVKGRIIDLSYTAALKLGLLGGVAPVQIERITPNEIRRGAWQRSAPAAPAVLNGDEPPALAAPPQPAPAAPASAVAGRGFWVQLGAFRERQGAEQLQSQAGESVDGLAPLLAIFNEQSLYRVQAGPFATRDQAQRSAERVREKLLLVPMLVERP